MSASTLSLAELRQQLHYSLPSAARFAGMTEERLQALERGEPPSVFEADALGRVYGIPGDRLLDEPIQWAPGDGIPVLASRDEFRDIPDFTRYRIVQAANAACDLVRLRRLECSDDPREAFKREAPLPSRAGTEAADAPYTRGAEVARQLRRHLDLGKEPIASLRDLLAARLPSINLLYAALGSHGPAGLTFADALRGPTIILNLEGKNANPCVRRFSLAHELCHLLVDWNRSESLGVLSGYLNESSLPMERVANAFAVRFLCPPSVVTEVSRTLGSREPSAAARILRRYGLPYAAVRLYLRNEGGMELPAVPPPELTGMGTEAAWVAGEMPNGLDGFPVDAPPERRTAVAGAAARAYSMGRISRDEFAAALGVTPSEDVERVLDHFALNRPVDENKEAA